MNKGQSLETYLSISSNKLGIYLFDTKNFINLYKQELNLNNEDNSIDSILLKKFLDNNIFKIEKLSKKFIKNIFLILEHRNIFNLEIGIKKKNYNISITRKNLENILIEAKDLFRENYPNQEIMHVVISKYFINNRSLLSFEENLNSDNLGLEIKFSSISSNIVFDLNKILESYQIKIIKYLDGGYVKNLFTVNKELTEMSHLILNGYNQNEISFLTKNPKKLGFFEKFFQLFS